MSCVCTCDLQEVALPRLGNYGTGNGWGGGGGIIKSRKTIRVDQNVCVHFNLADHLNAPLSQDKSFAVVNRRWG